MDNTGYDAAANLRAELARRKMTNKELGRLLGENEMWVGRRVNGHVPITVNELLRFARALDLPAADLLAAS